MDNTLIKATGLWKRTSASGREYLVGRLGGLKVLIFENGQRATEEDPTHLLLVGEAAAKAGPNGAWAAHGRDDGRGANGKVQRPGARGRPAMAAERRKAAVRVEAPADGDDPAPFNDDIPF